MSIETGCLPFQCLCPQLLWEVSATFPGASTMFSSSCMPSLNSENEGKEAGEVALGLDASLLLLSARLLPRKWRLMSRNWLTGYVEPAEPVWDGSLGQACKLETLGQKFFFLSFAPQAFDCLDEAHPYHQGQSPLLRRSDANHKHDVPSQSCLH